MLSFLSVVRIITTLKKLNMIFPSPREHCRPIYSGLSRRLTHICQPMGKVPWGSLLVFEDNKHLTLMTPAPKNPQRKLTVISKALKESPPSYTQKLLYVGTKNLSTVPASLGVTQPLQTRHRPGSNHSYTYFT